jgi:hypothetical protein
MSLTTYCEFDEVRSALGVNNLELSDSVLSLPVYEMGLIREFNRISPSLTAAFSAVRAIASASRTATQNALYDAVHLFSVYAAARQVGVSLPNFAPKDVNDGKASLSRFAGEPFERVLTRIDNYYAETRESARQALEVYSGSASATTPSLAPVPAFLASTRAYDPVTG